VFSGIFSSTLTTSTHFDLITLYKFLISLYTCTVSTVLRVMCSMHYFYISKSCITVVIVVTPSYTSLRWNCLQVIFSRIDELSLMYTANALHVLQIVTGHSVLFWSDKSLLESEKHTIKYNIVVLILLVWLKQQQHDNIHDYYTMITWYTPATIYTTLLYFYAHTPTLAAAIPLYLKYPTRQHHSLSPCTTYMRTYTIAQ
jgi:hypothetical protein